MCSRCALNSRLVKYNQTFFFLIMDILIYVLQCQTNGHNNDEYLEYRPVVVAAKRQQTLIYQVFLRHFATDKIDLGPYDENK